MRRGEERSKTGWAFITNSFGRLFTTPHYSLLPITVLDDSRKLYRLNAYSRSRLDVPKEVIRHSTWNGENFENLPLEELLKKQVVVATLSTASKLRNNGVMNGHFDMVIIDEAGQAMEPEAGENKWERQGGAQRRPKEE